VSAYDHLLDSLAETELAWFMEVVTNDGDYEWGDSAPAAAIAVRGTDCAMVVSLSLTPGRATATISTFTGEELEPVPAHVFTIGDTTLVSTPEHM
jgi:hypothetical protein